MKEFLEVLSEHPLTVRKIELSESFMIKKVYRRSLTKEECSFLGDGWKNAQITRISLSNNEEIDVVLPETSLKKKTVLNG